MNERIRELQIQAEAAADEIFDRKGKMYGEIVMEKFVQLIVAECASKVDSDLRDWLHDNSGGTIGDKLKQHFGVKE